MQRIETPLPGVVELRSDVYRDDRGLFLETYSQRRFAEIGIKDTFVQDNFSCSAKGVLRGLHYQLKNPQAKLCRVLQGAVFDVAVDVRLGSSTYGKWTSVILSAEKHNQLYVPAGFAHGFVALEENTGFYYKCSDFYDKNDEYGIVWNDTDLAITWDLAQPPLISEKDLRLPSLIMAEQMGNLPRRN